METVFPAWTASRSTLWSVAVICGIGSYECGMVGKFGDNCMRVAAIIGLAIMTCLGGCVDRDARAILHEVFLGPKNVRILASCSEAWGLAGSIAFFEISSAQPVTLKDVTEQSSIKGHWSRETSLMRFIEKHDPKEVPSMGRTILEGKACLQEESSRADEILFEDNPGLYFGAFDGNVVIVVFDDPRNSGVIFMSGR